MKERRRLACNRNDRAEASLFFFTQVAEATGVTYRDVFLFAPARSPGKLFALKTGRRSSSAGGVFAYKTRSFNDP